ncbi:peptidoglycan DD-metalloendopeptidase family protein [Alphaproteobacteria bacterium]|nr:peptidoglycan DD-metalloendopeptidase family protein [Alphaproteobacteria bacterium]
MKKAFKIRPLYHILITLVLCLPLNFYLSSNSAFSSTQKINKDEVPIKRPSNLHALEESADTISNMVQKVGAIPVVNAQVTRLNENETLSTTLYRLKFNTKDIGNIIASIYKLNNGKKILSTLPVNMMINYSSPSNLIGGALKFSYSKTNDIFVWQNPKGNYVSQVFLRPTKLIRTLVKGTINSSLYASAIKSGMPENTLLDMISLLGFSIDFQREIREGDSFQVLYTKEIDLLKNKIIKTKPITYASITLSGEELSFFNYKDKYGLPQYYDEHGKSTKRTIMKTPINGARLSSRYGARKHPVLGYTKMHRGLDFAAPSGTPVFAAGDGVVEKAGWNGSYGKYIKIRHTGTYKTAYAHLSSFHKSIRIGKRVLQGKTIGYVGTTGRSTGPHLHYEVLRNNRQVNPMKIKLPAGINIHPKKLKAYKNHVKNIINKKIALEKPNKNKKVVSNVENNSGNKKLN